MVTVAQPCKYPKTNEAHTLKGQMLWYVNYTLLKKMKIVWDRVLENYKYRGSHKKGKDIMKSKSVFCKCGWRIKTGGYKLYLSSMERWTVKAFFFSF